MLKPGQNTKTLQNVIIVILHKMETKHFLKNYGPISLLLTELIKN